MINMRTFIEFESEYQKKNERCNNRTALINYSGSHFISAAMGTILYALHTIALVTIAN